MTSVVIKKVKTVPEPIEVSHYTTNGLLNSNYKSIVKHNFSKSTAKSVFGIRQRIKSSQLCMVNNTGIVLKLSVFAMALVAIF
ncbi:hypothetical protein [uncultured Winogradskyella sp.]|uniref:hypothetical protein n=1 Tax=uncultured Winogradskyella sp. TaxID=395353 RepID=UPI0026145DFC|nr:hypothetical protein [uncultured Winogradskyella sp.]